MLLHLLNRSPASSLVHRDTLRAMGEEDRLLLIEDGVYGALMPLADRFEAIHGRLFALREDLASRGLDGRCDARVTVVDMEGFVTLTEESERTVSWF
ncbi:tRNA 2-thiouridine synthesizing protein B [Modicisalibacter muralis]|uniref:tRNA 2-thiouridine synthesizing protein B n=1 Tax=Modicisalibacter muralis TaxID=119000 RepID=A0A1G9GLP6_9GAMM|nr:sulfurtransferase complex subunit TusB [Halomonas muralis]SDL01193.1 tRNA 2-thiouridine synthesizing protein B [Halomonas muralis]